MVGVKISWSELFYEGSSKVNEFDLGVLKFKFDSSRIFDSSEVFYEDLVRAN